MTAMTVFGIIILLVAVALVVTVVLQEGKNNRLSGAISGGSADTSGNYTRYGFLDAQSALTPPEDAGNEG